MLEGNHALLLTPTAGGKTEAAVFPLLSRMLTEDWSGLSQRTEAVRRRRDALIGVEDRAFDRRHLMQLIALGQLAAG